MIDCKLWARGDDAMTYIRQSPDELLLKLFVELLPTRTVVEERPLAWRRSVFHGSLQEFASPNSCSVTVALPVYKLAAFNKRASCSNAIMEA